MVRVSKRWNILITLKYLTFVALFADIMDGNRRLPVTDPIRIKAQEKKLWAREVAWAIQEQRRTQQKELRMSCPCRLCDRGYRKELYVETVLQHLDERKMYGRDPRHYGRTQVKSNISLEGFEVLIIINYTFLTYLINHYAHRDVVIILE